MKYEEPSELRALEMLHKAVIAFTQYLNELDADGDFVATAHFDDVFLLEAIRRTDKRRYYYEIFHNMPKGVSEVKMAAIFCFWILRYRPFVYTLRDRAQSECVPGAKKKAYDRARKYFTEFFPIHLLKSIHFRLHDEPLELSVDYIDELVYNLQNADVSKEALVLIFETLVPLPTRALSEAP